jgi:hypothetical protein
MSIRACVNERERERDERCGDPVVQSALDVERPTDPHGDRAVDEDPETQGGIGRSEDDRDQCGLGPPDPQERHGDERPERHRQREADGEQSTGDRRVVLDVTEHDGRCIGEEQDAQGDLGDDGDDVGTSRHVTDIEPARTHERAERDEHHRRGDGPSIEAAGDDPVQRERTGEDRCGRHRPSPSALVDPLGVVGHRHAQAPGRTRGTSALAKNHMLAGRSASRRVR